jgi:hypothetical protein
MFGTEYGALSELRNSVVALSPRRAAASAALPRAILSCRVAAAGLQDVQTYGSSEVIYRLARGARVAPSLPTVNNSGGQAAGLPSDLKTGSKGIEAWDRGGQE